MHLRQAQPVQHRPQTREHRVHPVRPRRTPVPAYVVPHHPQLPEQPRQHRVPHPRIPHPPDAAAPASARHPRCPRTTPPQKRALPQSLARDTETPTAWSCGSAGSCWVISRKGAPDIRSLGKLRYVVEQTFALLHQFKRLAVRWERRLDRGRVTSPEAAGQHCREDCPRSPPQPPPHHPPPAPGRWRTSPRSDHCRAAWFSEGRCKWVARPGG